MATQPEFSVNLTNFSGPFELLLGLLAKRKLDITEVALAQVTDEFIAYMKQSPDLSQTSEFLVTTATLLAMKAASLLPKQEAQRDDIELLEARDLLFSRLLLYRVFSEATDAIKDRLDEQGTFFPREVPLEAHFAALLPDLVLKAAPTDLAKLAAEAIYYQEPTVGLAHLHDPIAPVSRELAIISAKLRAAGRASFGELTEDAANLPVVISRFLALLELFRADQVTFEQDAPMETLWVSWVVSDTNIALADDYTGEQDG